MSFLSLFKKQPKHTELGSEGEIERAIQHGIVNFFEAQRKQVPTFVNEHFRYPGCWETNRHAFGFDLIKAPINLIWAPFYVLLVLVFQLVSLAGHKKAKRWASALPGGMTTNVQTKINKKIRQSLLDQAQLKAAIINELKQLSDFESQKHDTQQQLLIHLNQIVDEALDQLMLTRTASADIANTLFSTAVGALAFNKFTPGGIGIGLFLAAYWVQERAEQSFIFGPGIGAFYYSIFPPKVSWIERGMGIAIVMVILAVIASFSGLVTDPIQSRMKLHQRRLINMLNQLERDLLHRSSNRFKPLDPYVARILELLDTLKIGL